MIVNSNFFIWFTAVIDSSTSMSKSPKLKQLLEIILALGNFMNRGQRGNATGFKLSSVNNMIDTKSSVDRNITLLHYLVDVLEKRVRCGVLMERPVLCVIFLIAVLLYA